jgi:transcriptional regulator with XRE-family HTH domain
MDMRWVVGSNPWRLRIAAGLSQDELAARTGLDRTYISRMENGRRNPTLIVLNDLAIRLDVDPRELLNPDVALK